MIVVPFVEEVSPVYEMCNTLLLTPSPCIVELHGSHGAGSCVAVGGPTPVSVKNCS